ncbi:MAG: AAA family ATPase [Myxococcales bacterium]|nr:AAA family ATPase [Myxococcales bacterium]
MSSLHGKEAVTPDRIAACLSEAAAWPVGAPTAEWIQTHISHVFLVGDRVYKLRKSVAFPFLDFTSREARNADCVREVALNRRLSPSVYLGVAPVQPAADGFRVGTAGEAIADEGLEHVTVMRRLPAGSDALAMLRDGRLASRHLAAVAERLARFHADVALGRPAPWPPDGWRERIAAPVRECVTALEASGSFEPTRIADLSERVERTVRALDPWLERRRSEGRAVEGHGDLHLDHVWFERDDEPLLIDCIEFDDDLRRIDPASEVAFLAMDLRYRDRADLAELFLAGYADRADDYGIFPGVDFYAAYRALVRAKVAAFAAQQDSVALEQRRAAEASAERHLVLAESLLEPRSGGSLLLMCGTVGSGKSTVARRFAEAGQGIPIASDRLRKRLAGLDPTDRTGAGVDQGLYDPDHTRRVYREMLARAAPVVESGRAAILDASFATREQRSLARSWAAEQGVPARLIEVRCARERARERLATRSRVGRDPSDAGPDFLAVSEARFEPPDEWPAQDRRVVDSDGNDASAGSAAFAEDPV